MSFCFFSKKENSLALMTQKYSILQKIFEVYNISNFVLKLLTGAYKIYNLTVLLINKIGLW